MDPQVLRGAFRLAFLITFLALLTLPFQNSRSAEFVVTIMALVVGLLFIGAVWVVARWSSPPIPGGRDKVPRSAYKDADHAIPTAQDGGKDE